MTNPFSRAAAVDLAPAPPPPTVDDPAAAFVALSEGLTGFDAYDLWGTGLVSAHLSTVERQVGHDYLMRLLYAEHDERQADPMMGTVQGAVLNAITKLWYTGAWMALPEDVYAVLDALDGGHLAPNVTFIPDREAYLNGLVWKSFGGHPMGGRPTGFGSWAEPPGGTGSGDSESGGIAADAPMEGDR